MVFYYTEKFEKLLKEEAMIIGILIGAVIGVVITGMVIYIHIVGTLRIDHSDPMENPYLFLELSKRLEAVTKKKYVVLRVNKKNYISHK